MTLKISKYKNKIQMNSLQTFLEKLCLPNQNIIQGPAERVGRKTKTLVLIQVTIKLVIVVHASLNNTLSHELLSCLFASRTPEDFLNYRGGDDRRFNELPLIFRSIELW